MEFKPVTGVWEITMGCNMRCMHCGSACTAPLPDELSTEEALTVCEDLGKLGFQWITLSGGEPTTRPDWDIIAAGLKKNNVIPNMITNGWLLDEKIIEKAQKAGINTIAISLDGLKETHDYIRKEGSFDRIMRALDIVKHSNIHASVITTVNNKNIPELPDILKLLEKKGVEGWQLQYGLPMGTMSKNKDLVAGPECVDTIISFAHTHCKNTPVDIQLADCVGYFNAKEIEVRQNRYPESTYSWNGCGAGKTTIGILHNGEIVGCTSIRNREFIEGSVREKSLIDIWNSSTAFTWNREMKKEKLSGFCARCMYANVCLGGCGNTRLTMCGSVYGENEYCSYHYLHTRVEQQFSRLTDCKDIIPRAKKFIEKNNLQLAESLLRNALQLEPENVEMLGLYGFVSFMLTNYTDAKSTIEKALAINNNDAYANKGMGLTLCRTGNPDEGFKYLRKAIELSDETFMDPYYDMAVMLLENNRKEEAATILNEAKEKSPDFFEKYKDIYAQIA